jgi:serine/threonine protein kinase
MLQSGTIVGRRYRVERLLDRGGMGVVYEVSDGASGPRALKVIADEYAHDPRYASLRERFLQEARIGAALKHPHICEVTDGGFEPHLGPYLVMELLQGENLEAYLTGKGRLQRTEARRVLEEAGSALACVHGAGVVHRDLKTSNVFLAGPARTVKLLDFGIAKLLAGHSASDPHSTVIGTHAWMAPEQLLNQPIDARTDVWAFGLLAFQVLTGRSFWRSGADDGPVVLFQEILYGDLPLASRRAAELGAADALPPRFDAWFARCVCREPRSRFENAAAAVAELRSLFRVSIVNPNTPTPASVATDPGDGALQAAINELRGRIPAAFQAMSLIVATTDVHLPPPAPPLPPPPPPHRGPLQSAAPPWPPVVAQPPSRNIWVPVAVVAGLFAAFLLIAAAVFALLSLAYMPGGLEEAPAGGLSAGLFERGHGTARPAELD